MVEGKLFKTKLCILYQKGSCHRRSCSFAHGNAELRASFNDRRDYHGGDLRDRIDRRRHSPVQRYSPGRDVQGRHASYGDSTRTPERARRRQQFDGPSDFSESLRSSEGTEDKIRGLRQPSSDSKNFLKEKLRKTQTEVKILDDHKRELENYLQGMDLETDDLNSRVLELEKQLSHEKEEYDRLTSKIKKFIKAHSRQMDLEDELKRSRSRFQKLGEQLSLEVSRSGATEDDLIKKNRSIGENAGGHVSPKYDKENPASPNRKRSRVYLEADPLSNQDTSILTSLAANPTKDQEFFVGNVRLERPSRWSTRSNNSKHDDVDSTIGDLSRSSADEQKSKKSKNSSADISIFDKEPKAYESVPILPSTSMAAHATDEVVDIVEAEEKSDRTGSVVGSPKELAFKIPPPPPPLPPPNPRNYAQYMEDEAVEVDIV